MKPRNAIKADLFADEHHRKKIDSLGDLLTEIESHIDFGVLAAEVDRVAPRPVSAQGGRPPYPTETMVRILVLKRLYNPSASTHDSLHFDKVIDTSNTSRDVYADRGYPSEARTVWLKQNGFRNHIQRKGQRNKPLSAECQQRRNTRIARSRVRVEHPFALIAQMGGKLIRSIGQARASFAVTMMAACYNLKRLVFFQKAGIVAF